MGRPRKDGTRIDNTMRRRGILMDYLRQEANGQHNWFAFSANGYALDRGECRVTIANDMRKLAEDGKVELDFQNGSRFFVRIPEPKEAPVETIPLRVCAKCGTEAPDPEARFCWKCGASLLRDRELLKEAFDRVFPKPAKFEFREKGLGIERVLFNDPATIVFWTDGTKTVVKCRKGDEWDAEKGLAMACAKKLMGNRDGYHKTLATYYKKEWVWEEEMGTEQIRYAVSCGCLLNSGCDSCPCNSSKGGTCYIIALADREELIAMLKEFEKADKWNYEDWRMSHA